MAGERGQKLVLVHNKKKQAINVGLKKLAILKNIVLREEY